MAVAGYTEVVYVRSDTTAPGSTDKVDGITDFTLSRSADVQEITDFKDGTGYKQRMTTLKDTSIDMSGQFEATDTVQQLLRSSHDSGATVYVTVHIDPSASSGSKGWRVPCIVESYDAKGQVGGIGEFSCKLVGNGAPVAV
jgi:predicted secreted protein